MECLFDAFAAHWHTDNYGDFSALEAEARAIIKAEFAELKEKQIKELLDSKLWLAQRGLMEKPGIFRRRLAISLAAFPASAMTLISSRLT